MRKILFNADDIQAGSTAGNPQPATGNAFLSDDELVKIINTTKSNASAEGGHEKHQNNFGDGGKPPETPPPPGTATPNTENPTPEDKGDPAMLDDIADLIMESTQAVRFWAADKYKEQEKAKLDAIAWREYKERKEEARRNSKDGTITLTPYEDTVIEPMIERCVEYKEKAKYTKEDYERMKYNHAKIMKWLGWDQKAHPLVGWAIAFASIEGRFALPVMKNYYNGTPVAAVQEKPAAATTVEEENK